MTPGNPGFSRHRAAFRDGAVARVVAEPVVRIDDRCAGRGPLRR